MRMIVSHQLLGYSSVEYVYTSLGLILWTWPIFAHEEQEPHDDTHSWEETLL